jgi:MFS family permease
MVATVLRTVWRNHDLRRVELAYGLFKAGESGTWLGMLVYAYAQGGVTEAGVLAAVMLVPAAVLAPVIASVADRRAPGDALVGGYVLQAVTCALVAGAMVAGAGTLLVYPLLIGPSIAYAATRPSQAAFAPGLARRPEELAATNAVTVWVESVAALVAPLLVGCVLTFASPGTVFLLGAAACAAAALLVLPSRRAVPIVRAAEGDAEASLVGSIAFVRRDANARTLLVMLAAQSVAIGALDVLYVELARGVLHRGGSWAGYLNAAFGVGSVLAVMVTARMVGMRRLSLPLVASVAAWTVALLGLAGTHAVGGALVLLAVAGVARTAFDVTGRTLLQRVSRPDLLARVFGLLEGLQLTGLAVGTLLVPVLVGIGGATAAFVGVGLVLPLVALPSGRRLLGIDRHATVPVVEIALLRSLPMFAVLPPPALESIARALVPITVSAGTAVIVQGEQGDQFYVVADGEVEVIADGATVTTLGRGAGFGEIALLYGVPRTATVRAKTPAYLYALERDLFVAALTGHPNANTTMRGLADQRLAELRALRDASVAPTTT